MKTKKILFLCTGNSCRSQIAEGFSKEILAGIANIRSAGTQADGLNPDAISIMQEINIDISNQKSKVLTDEDIRWANYLITLCGDARDKCPILDMNKTHIHWELEDPAKYKGDNKIVFFRGVRNQIRKHINNLRYQIEK